jgi:uncharacterized protein (TIGR03437 family)
VTVLPARPPLILAPDRVGVAVAQSIRFHIAAADPQALPVSFSALGMPVGASLDPATGEFQWTPDASGTFPIRFSAVNAAQLVSSKNALIRVVERVRVADIRNAASGSAGAVCAAGGWTSLFGAGFTSQDPARAESGNLPTILAGVSVRANGAPVPILYASEAQINFQCPLLAKGSPLSLIIEAETGLVTEPIMSTMLEAWPGVFLLGSFSATQGAVVISGSGEIAMNHTEGIPSRPAARGEYVSIFANALGSVEEAVPEGATAPLDHPISLKNQIRAYVGDVRMETSFAGLAPGAIGLYQVNGVIPRDSAAGPEVPLYVEVLLADGSVARSNTATIAVAGE